MPDRPLTNATGDGSAAELARMWAEGRRSHGSPDLITICDVMESLKWAMLAQAEAPDAPPERKPVGVSLVPEGVSHGSATLAVCDDGSTWWHLDKSQGWKEGNPIPGTRRARELAVDNKEEDQ